MPKGVPLVTCLARSKSTGVRCKNAPVPFVLEGIGKPLCRFHGGLSPAVLRKADDAFDHYLQFPEVYESPRDRARRIEAKRNFDARYARRLLRKQGIDLDEHERKLAMRSVSTVESKPKAAASEAAGFELRTADSRREMHESGFAYEGFDFDWEADVFGGGLGADWRTVGNW